MMTEEDENSIARAIVNATHWLGTGNSGTDMGAIEFLAVSMKAGLDGIANAIIDLAEAVRESNGE